MWINTPNWWNENNNSRFLSLEWKIFDAFEWESHIDTQKKKEYQHLIRSFIFHVKNPKEDRDYLLSKQESNKLIDNFNVMLEDREFIDCLVELYDFEYEIISQYIKIPQNIIELIEKNKIFQKHIEIIKKYRNDKTMWKKSNEEVLSHINNNLSNPLFKYIITYKTDNRLFNILKNDFVLPEDIIIHRKSYNLHILKNSDDEIKIQDSLCDLLFEDNTRNVQLNIGIILDRAKFVPEFLDDNDKELANMIDKFLDEDYDKLLKEEIMNNLIKDNENLRKSWLSIKKRLNNLINKAQLDFQDNLKNWLRKLNLSMWLHKQFNTTSWEKVDYYEIDNMDNSIIYLSRSMNFTKNWGLTKNKYWEFLSKHESWFSYSLMPSRSQFGRWNDSVQFWYFWFWNNKVMSANTFDSNSWQSPWIFRYKQQFYPLKVFLEQTNWYNEIYISNNEKIYPDYIISSGEPPKQEIIDLAYEFWIPVVFFKNNITDSKKWDTRESAGSYDYYSFGSKVDVLCPKCCNESSISKLLESL